MSAQAAASDSASSGVSFHRFMAFDLLFDAIEGVADPIRFRGAVLRVDSAFGCGTLEAGGAAVGGEQLGVGAAEVDGEGIRAAGLALPEQVHAGEGS